MCNKKIIIISGVKETNKHLYLSVDIFMLLHYSSECLSYYVFKPLTEFCILTIDETYVVGIKAHIRTFERRFTSPSCEDNIVVHRSVETLSVHLTFSLSVMETCSGLSPITPLKMKIPSGQETFNYIIDQSYLKDYELLIWAVKRT